MRKVFQLELQQVREDLSGMAHLVASAMERAAQAVQQVDLSLAQDVIEADALIDARQNELDEKCIDLLARQGPVAGDLRMIVGAMRMSASLERMGDLARHVAQLTRLRYPATVIPEPARPVFDHMAVLDLKVVRLLAELLETQNLEVTERMLEVNAQVNELHATVFRCIADGSWTDSPSVAVDLALASRYFERFADHALSVAGKVGYLVTGTWQESLDDVTHA